MKTRFLARLVEGLVFLAVLNLSPLCSFAQAYDAPTYRGKVVLVVDRSITSDPDVSWKIQRLVDDLTGDGWRVLRHDVERGPVHPHTANTNDFVSWQTINGYRVREIRALVKADYDSAPTDVKLVILIGHVPVPYSGAHAAGPTGLHFSGAFPADAFYGDMTSPYGATGWSDLATDFSTDQNQWPEFINLPGDGKFDQDILPSPLNLGVGRIDLFDMTDFGVNETTLISRYLNKNHDFRCDNFTVPRQAFSASWDGSGPCPAIGCPGEGFAALNLVFGNGNFGSICSDSWNWFADVSATNYLLGSAEGCCGGFSGTLALSVDAAVFPKVDSRVVFMNLYGSFMNMWDEQNDLLKAVLANPYDPVNGRFGYGLTTLWSGSGGFGLDQTSLTKRTLGATIGEATFVGLTGPYVNDSLMGDPTLRLHSVACPSGLTTSASASTVALSWSAATDGGVSGYNVYSAPTRKGPYILVNTSGPITGNGNSYNYNATRPASGQTPDNFYMVRAVKTESTPVGSYGNMSEGVIVPAATTFTPYLTILSQPASETVAAITQDGIANSVVFSVDAVGSDSAGDGQITCQWYYNGNALVDGGRIHGSASSALLISGVQDSDAGNYYVIVANGQAIGSTGTPIQSSTATLTIQDSPIAVNDTYTVARNTPTDLNVLANDSDPQNLPLTIVSVSPLAKPSAGTVTINAGGGSIHFTPAFCFVGTTTFTYAVSDGFTASQATVTVTVNNVSGETITISPIADQQVSEDGTLDVSFTVTDNDFSPDNLTYVATCSDSTLLPGANLGVTGSGNNRVLHIAAGTHEVGSGTVTVTVSDCSLQSTTVSFQVTINPASVPTLLPTGLQQDGFNLTVNGPPNSSVEILSSPDLVTWTSLGTFTLNGDLYNFPDAAATSLLHNFYRARNANGCSPNTIGFINVSLPAGQSVDIANQLNNPNGDTLDELFAILPNKTKFWKWNSATQTMTITANKSDGVWSPELTLNPGEGALIECPSTQPSQTVTLIGDVPQGQQINSAFPTTSGYSSLMSSIVPKAGTLDQLGFPAANGDTIQEFVNQQWTTTEQYNNGWTSVPSGNPIPTIQIAEAFFLISQSTTPRTWTENLPTCEPEVVLTSPASGSTFTGSASIPLSATATADAGVTQVEFFEGNVSLGLGQANGDTYTLNWPTPPAGTYAITAHATDNNGITTISTAANITVQPSLNSESYSAGNFQFTINGSAGVSVDVIASTDLANWTDLGTVTLTGGSYSYTDTGAGSFNYRYYRVKENGVCSANTIGFINLTLPAGEEVAIANQLNNPNGNTLDELFAILPNKTKFWKWNSAAQSMNITANKGGGVWSPELTLNPGEGAIIECPSTQPSQAVTLVGDVPLGQQVNSAFPTTIGQYSFMSSIVPLTGTLTSMGFPAQDGDSIQQWDASLQNWVTTETHSSGAWNVNPEVTIQIGQAFMLNSGSTTSRTWTENQSPCQ